MAAMAVSSSSLSAGDSILWQEAVTNFKAGLSPGVLHQCRSVTTPEDLSRSIAAIEKEQAARKSYRNLAKIRPFVHALRDYASVVEVFVNAKPDVMAFVWGPIKLCLQIASKCDQAFDSLLSAYSNIRDALPNFLSIDHLFGTREAISTVLRHVYIDILNFHKRAVIFFSRPGWRIALKLTCRALDDCYGDVLQNLAYSKELLYSRANIAHYHDSFEARQRTEQAFKDQQDRDRKSRRLAVQTWLSAFSHKDQQHGLEKLRAQYRGTCTWLFRERLWTKWSTGAPGTNPCFWISGIPGAGKTVLFSAMINELQSLAAQTQDSSAIAFVYCRYNDDLRDNFVALTRSLISSLLEANDAAYDYLYDIATNSHERFATTKEILSSCVFDMLEFYDHVTIGIDGLDEIEPAERQLMMQMIHNLLNIPGRENSPQIFLTSRAEHDLEKSFASTIRFKLNSEHVTPDIKNYVETRCHELQDFNICHTVIQDLVQQTVQRCEGMFLLAKLTFDMFQFCVSKEDLQEELETQMLPRGLDDAYDRILTRIRKQDEAARRPRATKLLEILALARRTLYLHEIQAALSISTEKGDIDIENRRYTQHFKQICGSLVEVNSDDSVVLVHVTAKRFLVECSHDLFEVLSANLRFADSCLTYLLMDFIQPLCNDLELARAVAAGSLSFYRYASRYWASHVLPVLPLDQSQPPTAVLGLYRKFVALMKSVPENQLDASEWFSTPNLNHGHIAGLRSELASIDQAFHQPGKGIAEGGQHPLFKYTLAQAIRLQELVEKNLLSSTDIASKRLLETAYGKKPFKCSNMECNRFYRGFASAPERDTHVKTHRRPYICEFPECVFSRTGFPTRFALNRHVEMFHVDNLCTKFAQIQARSPESRLNELIDNQDNEAIKAFCSVLEVDDRTMNKLINRAIRHGFAEAAFSIVEVVADKSPHSVRIYTPKLLQLIVSHGRVDLLKTALSARYPLEDSPKWRTERAALLRSAIDGGQHLVLRSLLKHDQTCRRRMEVSFFEDIVAKTDVQLDIVHAILEESFSSDDLFTMKTCIIAAKEDRIDIVDLILTYFSDRLVSISAFTYKEKALILQALDRARNLPAIKKMLEIGPDIDKLSFLCKAVKRNDLTILQTHVEQNIQVIDEDCKEIALMEAIRKDKIEVVQYLINRAVSIEACSPAGASPLAAAVALERLDIIQILVAAGAKFDTFCDVSYYGRTVLNPTTPLLTAIDLRKIRSLELLISLGADMNECRKSLSPLEVATTNAWVSSASAQVFEILEIILRAGADPNYTRCWLEAGRSVWNTSLHQLMEQWARFAILFERVLKTIQTLVSHGARCDIKDMAGRSVLFCFDALYKQTMKNQTQLSIGPGLLWDHLPQIWNLLVQNGADVDAEDHEGITARQYLSEKCSGLLEKVGVDVWKPVISSDTVNYEHSTRGWKFDPISPAGDIVGATLEPHNAESMSIVDKIWCHGPDHEGIFDGGDAADLVYNPWQT